MAENEKPTGITDAQLASLQSKGWFDDDRSDPSWVRYVGYGYYGAIQGIRAEDPLDGDGSWSLDPNSLDDYDPHRYFSTLEQALEEAECLRNLNQFRPPSGPCTNQADRFTSYPTYF